MKNSSNIVFIVDLPNDIFNLVYKMTDESIEQLDFNCNKSVRIKILSGQYWTIKYDTQIDSKIVTIAPISFQSQQHHS